MGFINYLINGISLGSVYAIIALGYTMVYGIAKMLNFAHGDVIMIGSDVVFVTVSTMGLPPMAGVLLAVAVGVLLKCYAITKERRGIHVFSNISQSLLSVPGLCPYEPWH